MNLGTLYEAIGSDYQTVLDRFCGYDAMLAKFVADFPEDMTFRELAAAVREADYPEVEGRAHALKGVAGNLGFERLHTACGDLVLSVRYHRLGEVPEIFRRVEKEYRVVYEAIQDMMKS